GREGEVEMDRSGSSVLTSVLCVLFAISAATESGENPDAQHSNGTTITITHFRVDDQKLSLGWTITNHSDHEVWILDDMSFVESPFEVYLADDDRTLLIQRKLDVLSLGLWFITPQGRYVRLRPGEEKLESISLDVPVSRSQLFPSGEGSIARFAEITRIALEIGFYDEDLPELIRGILIEAEKLSPEITTDSGAIRKRYFPGVSIYLGFGGLSDFEGVYTEGSNEVWVPYMYQAFEGERVLRATVDDLSIPYGTQPAEGEPPQIQEDARVKIVLAKLVVDDQNFEMGWKIINNTDHDVWICDSATDWFMDTDNETLVIRMRYNISNAGMLWEIPPFYRFRYSRLRPGEQKVKSIARAVPVTTDALFKYPLGSAEHARRVALEIGHYDEDLRALILDIVNVAERLNCDWSAISFPEPENTRQVYNRFFGGVLIARLFNVQTYFRDSVTSGGDEIIAPYFRQALHGEQVLRLEVDNVSIPFGTKYQPLTRQAGKGTKDLQSQKTSNASR
ncbi:MAG: hypothetical protein ACYTE3_12050, partial [Planctomycetota bacterium]